MSAQLSGGAFSGSQLNPLKRRVKLLTFDFTLKSLIGACHLGTPTQRFPVKKHDTAFNWVNFLSLHGSESQSSENLETDLVVHFNKG